MIVIWMMTECFPQYRTCYGMTFTILNSLASTEVTLVKHKMKFPDNSKYIGLPFIVHSIGQI